MFGFIEREQILLKQNIYDLLHNTRICRDKIHVKQWKRILECLRGIYFYWLFKVSGRATFFSVFTLLIRRLHDSLYSGLWILLLVVPFTNGFVFYRLFIKGSWDVNSIKEIYYTKWCWTPLSSTPFCVSWSNSVMYILNRLEYYGFKLVG